VAWDRSPFAKGSPVAALLEGDRLHILPQPVQGDGSLRSGRFARLGDRPTDPRTPIARLTDAAAACCMRVKFYAPSSWSKLIPVLFALISAARPRRYVELGVYNGMSFFAACQAAEAFKLDTECIAVDSWLGDEHTGFHSEEVFGNFKSYLENNHRKQFYIQNYFDPALKCFEDGSIDLLHIDGLHTYDAVRSDFESWLPKMSDTGIIMLHDTNVLERDFGVWRFWEELSCRYPGFNFRHEHGLAIVYVGSAHSPVGAVLRDLATHPERATLAQTFFEAAGTLSIEHRARLDDNERLRAEAELLHHRIHQIHSDHAIRTRETEAQMAVQLRDIGLLRTWLAETQTAARLEAEQLHTVYRSSCWRITAPVRRILSRSPLLHRVARGTAHVIYRTFIRPLKPRR
jgi:hypothetical protein